MAAASEQSLLFFPSPFFLLVSVLFCKYLLHRMSGKLPYPPGPKGFPIIGNMLMMDQLTHRGLAKLSTLYGGIFHMKMGVVHMVVVSTPEIARQVLQVHDNVFCSRPANIAIAYLTYKRSDMVFAPYGPLWRRMRKICVMKLLGRSRAESWASVREEVDSMVGMVAGREAEGRSVNVGELMSTVTRNITYRAAFGSTSHERQEEFRKILDEFSRLFGVFNFGDFIPWLGWLNGRKFNKELAEARGSLDEFISEIIEDHLLKRNRKNRDGSCGSADSDSDMVDELLAFCSEEAESESESTPATTSGLDDTGFSLKLTRDNIKAIIMDIMFGGTGSVASVVEWGMAELLIHPEELKKVQEELLQVVGLNRRPNESDLEKLIYLKCCVKETLRLHPPLPLVLRQTTRETAVAGYSIPAGAHVMVNITAVNRDKTAWDEPDAFKPERFMGRSWDLRRGSGNFEFIPFGSGRRSCPGMQLGVYEVEMALANLLHCFTWELPDGMNSSEMDMEDAVGVTASRATQLVAVPIYRLQCPAVALL